MYNIPSELFVEDSDSINQTVSESLLDNSEEYIILLFYPATIAIPLSKDLG